jgi:predicted Zn-dependent peptidase
VEPARAHVPKAIETPALIAAPLPGDPTRTTIHRLSNGMTVYLSPDPEEPSVVAHIAVRAGSRNDPEQSTGLAHYLEHMLFKGTHLLGTLDYAKEKIHLDRIARLYDELRAPGSDRARVLHDIDAETQQSAAYAVPNELDHLYSQLGITGLNAWTNNDATVYIAKVPKNRMAQWARVEAQRYAGAVFRLFWPELEAVYEEKNRSLDNPHRRWFEAFMKAMFPRHGYGWSTTLGEIDHLKNPAYADMEAFFHRYYTPQNMAIVLAGDVDASVLPMLEDAFRAFQRPPGDAPEPGVLPQLTGRTSLDVPVPSHEGVILGWPLVSATHADRIVIEVMDRLLLDGTAGILQRDLMLPQKVARAGSNPSFLREAGYFELYADALAGQTHAELEQLLLDALAKLKRGEFTDADLATAILSADIEQQRGIETNAGRASAIERAFIAGDDWQNVVERIDQMRHVTRAQILAAANQYLTGDFLVVRKVKGVAPTTKITKPGITAVKVDPSRRGRFAQALLAEVTTPIEPVALVAGRDYVRTELVTGPLISVVNSRNGLFQLRFEFDFGRADDRVLGLALEVLKVSGAGTRSAEQLARELHALGVIVNTSSARADASITLAGIDRNLEPALALLHAWLADPVFDEQTVKARVAAVKTERANALANPQTIAAAQQEYARHGEDTDYLVIASNHQLDTATPDQLKAVLAGLLHTTHRTAYFGPRAADAAARAVVLGNGTRVTGPRRPVTYRAPNTTLITDQATAQTHIWLTWPRAPSTDAERATGVVFSEYIRPILYQEVREARGLAYSVYGGYGASARKADAGAVFAYVGTQGDKAHDAVDAMLATLHAAVDEQRFGHARDSLAERFRVDRIAPRDIAATVYRWEDQGDLVDPRAGRFARAMTVDRAALARWMTAALAGPVIVSITGDHGKLDDARLSQLAPITMVPVDKLFGY